MKIANNVDMSSQRKIAQQTQAAYCKKSPSHVRRDTQRKVLRAKRQRMDENEVESERQDDVNQGHFKHEIDSPHIICEPPSDDTLILSPLLPISIDFKTETETSAYNIDESSIMIDHENFLENEIKIVETDSHIGGKSGGDVKCSNCDDIFEWNHLCNILDESVDAAEQQIGDNTEIANDPQHVTH